MITAIACGLSAATVAALYILLPTLSFWWLLPIAAGAYIAYNLIYGLFFAVVSGCVAKKEGQPHKEFIRQVIVHTTAWVLDVTRTKVTVYGAELLPKDTPFLLVCNHLSAFDPIVTLAALADHRLAFISKPENLRIPFVGRLICGASFLTIDRDNARNAVTTIRQAAEFITERGLSMGIYPEGTRSKTGEMLPFRHGAFKIAKLAHCPIAVLSIQYGKRRWPLGAKPVRLQVITVLDTAYVEDNRTNAISERVEALIKDDIQA